MPRLPTPPTTIQLRYAQLEQLVANLLEVHPERRNSLSARFRLFRQRGFPPNVISLARTRFAYELDAVLQVTLAFWMMQSFIPQESVPRLIKQNWGELRNAFGKAFALLEATGSEEAGVDDDRPVLLIKPRNLAAFSRPVSEQEDSAPVTDLMVTTAREAQTRMFGIQSAGDFEPLIFIDLHRLAEWVRQAIITEGWAGLEPFRKLSEG